MVVHLLQLKFSMDRSESKVTSRIKHEAASMLSYETCNYRYYFTAKLLHNLGRLQRSYLCGMGSLLMQLVK